MSKVDYLPVWHSLSTPAERLRELVHMAEKHPERFEKFVITYVETLGNDDSTRTQCHFFGCKRSEAFGLLEMGKQHLWGRDGD